MLRIHLQRCTTCAECCTSSQKISEQFAWPSKWSFDVPSLSGEKRRISLRSARPNFRTTVVNGCSAVLRRREIEQRFAGQDVAQIPVGGFRPGPTSSGRVRFRAGAGRVARNQQCVAGQFGTVEVGPIIGCGPSDPTDNYGQARSGRRGSACALGPVDGLEQ